MKVFWNSKVTILAKGFVKSTVYLCSMWKVSWDPFFAVIWHYINEIDLMWYKSHRYHSHMLHFPHSICKLTIIWWNPVKKKKPTTHQTPPVQQDHCLSLQPCWFQHKHTCQHHFFWCWKSSTCLLGSENEGQREEKREGEGRGEEGEAGERHRRKWKSKQRRMVKKTRRREEGE